MGTNNNRQLSEVSKATPRAGRPRRSTSTPKHCDTVSRRVICRPTVRAQERPCSSPAYRCCPGVARPSARGGVGGGGGKTARPVGCGLPRAWPVRRIGLGLRCRGPSAHTLCGAHNRGGEARARAVMGHEPGAGDRVQPRLDAPSCASPGQNGGGSWVPFAPPSTWHKGRPQGHGVPPPPPIHHPLQWPKDKTRQDARQQRLKPEHGPAGGIRSGRSCSQTGQHAVHKQRQGVP